MWKVQLRSPRCSCRSWLLSSIADGLKCLNSKRYGTLRANLKASRLLPSASDSTLDAILDEQKRIVTQLREILVAYRHAVQIQFQFRFIEATNCRWLDQTTMEFRASASSKSKAIFVDGSLRRRQNGTIRRRTQLHSRYRKVSSNRGKYWLINRSQPLLLASFSRGPSPAFRNSISG